jgi:hypothetical protein
MLSVGVGIFDELYTALDNFHAPENMENNVSHGLELG